MNKKFIYILLCCLCGSFVVGARTIKDKQFKLSVTIPDQMFEIVDTANSNQGKLYFDTSAGIIMMFSASERKFKSVHDYLDCSREKLQQELQNNYEDSTLLLVSCGPAAYYPEKTTALQFRLAAGGTDYDSHLIYFIHHHKREIQISFTYKKAAEERSLKYINGAMKTLELE